MTSTTTPSSICSTRWCASRCSSPTDLRGGLGFRCWRRSASSPRSNSSLAATANEVRAAHARYFAGREADILALWDSPRQREAYTGSTPSWPICAPRFGGPPTRTNSTLPPPSRHTRRSSAKRSNNYEPISWAEELIEPARRRRPSPAGVPVRDGVAVLESRTDRGGCRLQRRRPAGCRQWPPRSAVRP